jgi:hypothetical protein
MMYHFYTVAYAYTKYIMKGKVNPMCRTVFSALIISLSIANPLFGQTPIQEAQSAAPSQMLQLSSWGNKKFFLTLDNTQISNEEGLTMLQTAPANQTLMRQMRRLKITHTISGYVTLVALAGSAITWIQVDINKPSTFLAPLITGGIGLWGSVIRALSHDAYTRKAGQSVNNYNLYIMGIPILH